eukprot:403340527
MSDKRMTSQRSFNDLKLTNISPPLLTNTQTQFQSIENLANQKSGKLVGSLLTSKSKDQLYNVQNSSKVNNSINSAQQITNAQNNNIRKILPSAPYSQFKQTFYTGEEAKPTTADNFRMTASSYFKKQQSNNTNSSTNQNPYQNQVLQPLKIQADAQKFEMQKDEGLQLYKDLKQKQLPNNLINQTPQLNIKLPQQIANQSSSVLQSFVNIQNPHRLRPLTNSNANQNEQFNSQNEFKNFNIVNSNQFPRSSSRPTKPEEENQLKSNKFRGYPLSLDRKSQVGNLVSALNGGNTVPFTNRVDIKLSDSDFTKFKDGFRKDPKTLSTTSPNLKVQIPPIQKEEQQSIKNKLQIDQFKTVDYTNIYDQTQPHQQDKIKNIKTLQKNLSASKLYLPPQKEMKILFPQATALHQHSHHSLDLSSQNVKANNLQNAHIEESDSNNYYSNNSGITNLSHHHSMSYSQKFQKEEQYGTQNEESRKNRPPVSSGFPKSQSAQSLLIRTKKDLQNSQLKTVDEEHDKLDGQQVINLEMGLGLNAAQVMNKRTPDDSKMRGTGNKFFEKRFIDRITSNQNENPQQLHQSQAPQSTISSNINNSANIMSSYYSRPKQDKDKSTQFLKYSAISKAGRNSRLVTKTNQDSYSVIKGYCGSQTNWFFGVFDGHGTYGHFASEYASRCLSQKLVSLVNSIQHHATGNKAFEMLKNKDPNILHQNQVDISSLDEQNLRSLMTAAYEWTNEQMGLQGFDVSYSGSTSVTLVVVKDYFIVANAGDSRCILFKNNSTSVLNEAEGLSRDHKPNLAGESERIISKNGRIDAFKDSSGHNVGPMRVWMKHEDIPGLAMSRSLGDAVAESLGVIATPDIKFYKRQYERDRALVVCSDGVTEFMEDQQIGEIIEPFYKNNDTEGACRKLVEEATNQWLKEESVIDDITAIVIFFH